MKFKVDLDVLPAPYHPAGRPRAWIASVEVAEPVERTLLRNAVGNLEQCQRYIADAITKHVLNPWGQAVKLGADGRPL